MTLLRLAAYAPNGARLGPLPSPVSIDASWPFLDLGAVSFSYPPTGALAAFMGSPMEISAEVSTDGGATWVEPKSGRFLYLRDARDPVRDDLWTADCPQYGFRLKKALVPFTGLDVSNRRQFTTVTAGSILLTLMSEAQTRGALTGVGLSWNATNDSNGTAWTTTRTVAYEPGKDFLSILQDMAENGWLEYDWTGRTLNLYVPGGGSRNPNDLTPEATLRKGRDLTEAPFRRTWENLADTAFVVGDANINTTRTAAGATMPWGRQETLVSAVGINTAAGLNTIGDAALTMTTKERVEYTFGIAFGRARSLPHRDYFPGDWVSASLGDLPIRLRVRQITLSREADGATTGNVVLNDRFTESDIRQKRLIDDLLNGATAGLYGSV